MTDVNQQNLEQAYAALDYELSAFITDALALITGQGIGPWGNEVLEAYLVHARILADFLRPEEAHRHDIKPEDFGVDWTWPSTPEAKAIEVHVTSINRHLAHLSWERAAERNGAEWNIYEISALLLPIFSEFLDQLETSHPDYSAAMRARIEHWRTVVTPD